jgi:hypothetical protein
VPTGSHELCFSRDGQVAQLVEQRTENPCVGGSIPSLATFSQTQAHWCAQFVSTLSAMMRRSEPAYFPITLMPPSM